jgi:FixJ family two-component response regulator
VAFECAWLCRYDTPSRSTVLRGEPCLEETRPVILVLDDDASIRRSLARLFRALGLELRSFASAGELLASERPEPPVCLLLDLHLPDMNGLELLRSLHDAGESLPVVVVTGGLDKGLRERALQAGAAGFLTKPFDDLDLLAAIRHALGQGASL